MKDLRDPIELGNKLLNMVISTGLPLTKCYDQGAHHTRDYDHNPGPIEKYGDPTKLPSTLGTPIE